MFGGLVRQQILFAGYKQRFEAAGYASLILFQACLTAAQESAAHAPVFPYVRGGPGTTMRASPYDNVPINEDESYGRGLETTRREPKRIAGDEYERHAIRTEFLPIVMCRTQLYKTREARRSLSNEWPNGKKKNVDSFCEAALTPQPTLCLASDDFHLPHSPSCIRHVIGFACKCYTGNSTSNPVVASADNANCLTSSSNGKQ